MTWRQYRFWAAQSLTPDTPLQRFFRVVWLPPALARAFESAWSIVARESDALCARLRVESRVPHIEFTAETPPVRHVHMQAGDDLAIGVEQWANQGVHTYGDGDFLYRNILVHVSDGTLLWLHGSSHLVSDGRSMDMLFDRLRRVMVLLSQQSPVVPFRFLSCAANMAAERQADLSRLARLGDRDVWSERLDGWKQPLQVFGVTASPGVGRKQKGVALLSRELTDRLHEVCASGRWLQRSAEMTLSNLLVALHAVWALKHGGQTRFVIGVPYHGRTPAEKDLIGFKSGMLPARVEVDPEQSIMDLVVSIHEEIATARKLDAPSIGNSFHEPTFPIANNFRYQRDLNIPPEEQLRRLEVPQPIGDPEWVSAEQQGRTDLPGAMRLTLTLREELLVQTTVDEVIDGFVHALEAVITNPEIRVRDIPFVSPAAGAALRARGEAVAGASKVTWIRDWLLQIPGCADRPAIIHGDDVLTHGQLLANASRWATWLDSQSLARGQRVLVVARSGNALAALWLGLMSRGLTYVPVNPAMPDDQVLATVRDLDIRLVLCDSGRLASLRDPLASRCVALDTLTVAGCGAADLSDAQPGEVAHIFHTSGSTGRPKAIAVSHAALATFIDSWVLVNAFLPGERLLHFYATTFDPWLTGIMTALKTGGTCVIEPQDAAPSGARLRALLERHAITTLCTPTAYFHAMCDFSTPSAVRRWIVGGEALAADKARRFITRQPHTGLINAYGPTETTVWSCVLVVSDEHRDNVPIGAPLPSCGFRVTARSGDPVPTGVPGELWISGPQLAEGYVGQPELTDRQFVQRDGQRWYRTGDLVRWRKDGNLDFLGRIDRQVQVRGHRVEPAEIEIALRALPDIRDALVVPVALEASTALCGYVIPADHQSPDDTTLRSALLRVLPEYKVPKWLITVDAFPQSPNGKVDPSKLPAPQHIDRPAVPDRLPSLTLWDLRIVFEDVLRLPRVGIDESFFDLGGDSLRLVELLAAIEKRFGKALDATAVMAHPTIGGLAPLLEQQRTAPAELIVELRKGPENGSAPPLFCIPGAGGIGVEFYPLSRRLPDDQPVIVLRSSGTDGHSHPPATIDALLDEHIRHILTWRDDHNDTRPVRLMGYSLGGIFAWEIAQRLHARNIPVDHIFLIDAHVATDQGRALFQRPRAGLRERVRELVKGRPADDERRLLASELEEARRQGRIMDAASLGRYNLLVQASFYKDIHSQPASFQTTYFLAENGPRREHADAWKHLTPNLTIHTIPGDHDGDNAIVREPCVEALATIMLTKLENDAATEARAGRRAGQSAGG